MTTTNREKYLKIALVVVGGLFTFALYPLTVLWPAGWCWHAGHSDYLQMILGVYATLGVFLMIAARNPSEHKSLIWFAIWSSVVHAGIMAVQSLANPNNIGHLLGDVPALLLVAGLLGVLMPRGAQSRASLGKLKAGSVFPLLF